jgi:transposase
MQAITTIGLDIAKSVFQVHGIDGKVLFRRQLKRRYVLAFFQKLPSCLVGIEACASSHHWSRELQALGHTVRLMAPAYVKPYVKRQKNDAADAEAICEAVTRANMRFVETKTPSSRAARAHLAEFGIVAPVGRNGVEQLLGIVADPNDKRLPEVARACIAALGTHLRVLKTAVPSSPCRRMKAICASVNFDLFMVRPRPTATHAAKLEFSSNDRSKNREAGQPQ